MKYISKESTTLKKIRNSKAGHTCNKYVFIYFIKSVLKNEYFYYCFKLCKINDWNDKNLGIGREEQDIWGGGGGTHMVVISQKHNDGNREKPLRNIPT